MDTSIRTDMAATAYQLMAGLSAHDAACTAYDTGERDLGMSGDILAIGRNQFVSY